jgi:hypothetical protein
MKNYLILAGFILAFLTSCKKEDTTTTPPTPTNTDTPSGVFTKTRAGNFVKQNSYNAEGAAEIGSDVQQINWIHLAPNFNASLSTGAVTLYISKTQQLNLSDASSNVRVASITKAGEQYYKTSAVSADFKFAILWCSSANIQFGNAELK